MNSSLGIEPGLALNRIVVLRYRTHLDSIPLAPGTMNLRLAAVRRLAYEASDSGLLSPEWVAGHPPGQRHEAARTASRQLAGGWEGQQLVNAVRTGTLCGKRDAAMLGLGLSGG